MVGLERQVLYEAHTPTKHQDMIQCWRTLVDRFGKVGLHAAAEMVLSQRRECLVVVDLGVQTGNINCPILSVCLLQGGGGGDTAKRALGLIVNDELLE